MYSWPIIDWFLLALSKNRLWVLNFEPFLHEKVFFGVLFGKQKKVWKTLIELHRITQVGLLILVLLAKISLGCNFIMRLNAKMRRILSHKYRECEKLIGLAFLNETKFLSPFLFIFSKYTYLCTFFGNIWEILRLIFNVCSLFLICLDNKIHSNQN